jgi:hypothetical protein
MAKIDFKKEMRELYQPSAKDFELIEVPEMQFLMIDGRGDPNTSKEYQDALEALYALAYKIKFTSKRELGRDYVVPPLEGLWWAEDMRSFSSKRDKSKWEWTAMVMQPEWITQEMLADAKEQAAKSKQLAALPKVRLESYREGLSAQILHIGSFEDEAPTLRRLHEEFLPGNGCEPAGKHHEIYLSDPRRVAPEKLKTVLRQPVRRI